MLNRRTFMLRGAVGLSASAWVSRSADAEQNEPDIGASGASRAMLDNNLRCVDLSDLTAELPLDIDCSKQILWRTEKWEHSTWGENPSTRPDSVGYPTIVRNDRGPQPDNLFYLFYAQHDPNSGIGCAVSDCVEGPYRKLADVDRQRGDSQVLVNPGKPGGPQHYSSPCVIWSPEEELWFMYFHDNDYRRDGEPEGQWTALATCADLTENIWKPWTNDSGRLIAVLPTTKQRWMNSQSSYHAIQRLSDGRWLAFMRGTGGEHDADGKWLQDTPMLGMATSSDGRSWNYFPENPVIHQQDGGGGLDGVYRPHFIGYLGDGEFLVCWSETRYYDQWPPSVVYGKTRDFKTFERDSRGCAKWLGADGLISPWREGDKLYLFADKHVHTMRLPVG